MEAFEEFFEFDSFAADSYGVCALEFDSQHDLLLVGNVEGRFSTFYMADVEKIEDENFTQPRWGKYSSVAVARDPVLDILPTPRHVLALSKSQIAAVSVGGLRHASISIPQQEDIGAHEFSCVTGLVNKRKIVTKIMAGTTSNYCYVFDLHASLYDHKRTSQPIMTFDAGAPTACIQSGGLNSTVIVGGQDGKVRLVDGRLRSSKVLHTLDCHSGPLLEVDVHMEGNVVLTCGLLSRPANGNFPASFVPDPLIKAFDLRTNKHFSPVTMSVSTPSFVRFVPMFGSFNLKNVLVSPGGLVQFSNLSFTQAGTSTLSDTQILQTAKIDRREAITSVAVSSSGQLVCVGTNCGYVTCFASADSVKYSPKPRINEVSNPIEILPLIPPPPPLSLPVNAPVLATSYILTQPAEHFGGLASSFASTPTLLKRKLQLNNSRIITDEVSSQIQQRDFIGSLKNNGVLPNSLLYGANEKKYFLNGDPRLRRLLAQAGLSGEDSGSAAAANIVFHTPAALKRTKSFRGGKQRIVSFDYSVHNLTDFVGLENNCPLSFVNPLVQMLYSIEKFRNAALQSQASAFHQSSAVSLWCELGFVFHMMQSVQQDASQAGASAAVDRVVTAMNFQRACKQLPEAISLGLVDTNATAAATGAGAGSTSSSSTTSTTSSTGGTGTSGSGSATSSSSQLDSQLQLYGFNRFLLQQLNKEIEAENKFNAANGNTRQLGTNSKPGSRSSSAAPSPTLSGIVFGGSGSTGANLGAADEVFGYSVATTTTFLTSGTREVSSPHRSLILELAYPVLKKPAGMRRPPAHSPAALGTDSVSVPEVAGSSFASVFYASILKETQLKGWCSASEKYEPFKQVRAAYALPPMLCVSCGDTYRDAIEVTVAGAMGEAQGVGSMHQNFWSRVTPSSLAGEAVLNVEAQLCFWLPLEVEIIMLNNLNKDPTGKDSAVKPYTLIVSTRSVVYRSSNSGTPGSATTPQTTLAASSADDMFAQVRDDQESNNKESRWTIYDGISEAKSAIPASETAEIAQLLARATQSGAGSEESVVTRYGLQGIISQIAEHNDVDPRNIIKHHVLHLRRPPSNDGTTGDPKRGWHVLNDFVVSRCTVAEVLTFPNYRHPELLYFQRIPSPLTNALNKFSLPASTAPVTVQIPRSVFNLPSISGTPCLAVAKFPQAGDLVAIDGEFVNVEPESATVNAVGQRVIASEGRQALARISLVTGEYDSNQDLQTMTEAMVVLADDYILPTEPVVDYVTRFSGVTADDLSPTQTRHALVHQRTAYLKLRAVLDAGCVFVGHGLQKDFETANVYVPQAQIRDTVELWRLPHQRKISLRFLASYLLNKDIQDEVHDSIEDAKTAMQLYFHYRKISEQGQDHLQTTLRELYSYGNRTNWTIGLERL